MNWLCDHIYYTTDVCPAYPFHRQTGIMLLSERRLQLKIHGYNPKGQNTHTDIQHFVGRCYVY